MPPACPSSPGRTSSLPAVEAHGATFRAHADSASADALALLHAHGVNAVRLRLWHTPADGTCDLAATTAMARRARSLGMTVLLDLHLSDTWADPAHQSPPAAWAALAGPVLEDSVRRYAREVIATMRAAGATPEFVQIGNEVGHGMLWPHGAVDPFDPEPDRWRRFARLFGSAVEGVREGSAGTHPPRVMLHLEHGGDPRRTRAFLDRLAREGGRFDAVGLSYYPWWHGSLDSLAATLAMLGERDFDDVYVVETAYPWTLRWADGGHNVVGLATQLHPGYPATPESQAAFVRRVRELVQATPNGRGRGVFYWEPADVAAPGRRSSWENLALFGFEGVALPALDALTGRPR